MDKLNPAKVVNLRVSGPVDISRFCALQHLLVSHGALDCSKLRRCHDLRSVSFNRQVSDLDMETIVQWLTTSRVLKSIYAGTVGNLGFEAIARTLPVWIAHGLEELGLGHPWNLRPIPSSKQRLLLLADALATKRDHRKTLKVYVDLGKRALDSEEISSPLVHQATFT
ncbi:hypothetical protein SPRG_00128 [Saprolegnia parasitica CBS 223.65]|uniref:Uncharacterized protein n=1 Tax=Saprolegnia parasitica (strain CBS 223.65) TaxID=695850 RepID=A0A067D9G6_SAPPC|nr:hypothetical protein SPRG_00128 [Saprolegnia parasitica CBS 223.65]KDO35281.1 hypothetical protein SPRG_00128 [Saprolegnia parasitica CBS 223.65]|eukprot:XP_012193631.1 hypothetical protein SPRG_00128 [Saprolegnia parasitica CBS 223.65]